MLFLQTLSLPGFISHTGTIYDTAIKFQIFSTSLKNGTESALHVTASGRSRACALFRLCDISRRGGHIFRESSSGGESGAGTENTWTALPCVCNALILSAFILYGGKLENTESARARSWSRSPLLIYNEYGKFNSGELTMIKAFRGTICRQTSNPWILFVFV